MIIYWKRISDGEIVEINTNLTDRDLVHVWLSGQPLGRAKTSPELVTVTAETTEEVAEVELSEEQTTEKVELHRLFEEKFQRPVPNVKKNDLERIQSKLAE